MKLGDIRTYRVVIDGMDVTDSVIGSHIFQDITNPTWSAQVYFMDSADLLNTIPIKSGSIIRILMETKHNVHTDMKHEFEFVVYKIDDKANQGQKTYTYTIYAATEDFVKSLTTRVSKNFNNRKMTDCIREVVSDNFNGMSVTGVGCDNNANVIIPNWTPYDAIGWQLKMAHSGGVADFLFFQSDDKVYTLDTIRNCYGKLADSTTLRVKPANMGDDNPLNVFNMIKYYFQHADATVNLGSGYYGNTLKTFDFRTKEWNVSTSGSSEKNTSSVNSNPNSNKTDLFNNASESLVTFKAKSKGILQNGNSPADDAEVWLQSRMRSLQGLEQEVLQAQIAGTVGAYRWIGQTINVDVPNQDANTIDSFDRKRKGRYLVTNIAHYVNRQTYTISLGLVQREVI